MQGCGRIQSVCHHDQGSARPPLPATERLNDLEYTVYPAQKIFVPHTNYAPVETAPDPHFTEELTSQDMKKVALDTDRAEVGNPSFTHYISANGTTAV